MKKLFTFCLAFIGIVTVSLAHDHAASPLQTALEQYVKIQTALAGDSLKGVSEAAAAIAETAKNNSGALPEAVMMQAEAIGKAPDIKAARVALKPLSMSLISAASALKDKTGHYYEAFCPMAGAAWIQADKKVANPYYGASMLTCGEIRKEL